jgi:hypothetical protein
MYVSEISNTVDLRNSENILQWKKKYIHIFINMVLEMDLNFDNHLLCNREIISWKIYFLNEKCNKWLIINIYTHRIT